MKRIYMALALISGLAFGAKAQTIDLWAFTDVDSCIHLGESFDTVSSVQSPLGIYGIGTFGPDLLKSGDQIIWNWSFGHYLTEAEAAAQVPPVPFEDRYFWLTSITLNADIANDSAYVYAQSFDPVDSISMLMDWARWQQYGKDSVRLYGPPHENFVNGQAYGFFVRVYGLDNATTPTNTDNDKNNNWAVQKVIWNSSSCARSPLSIGDILVPKEKESLVVYPNPATTEINFDYALPVYSNAFVSIADATGRVVYRKNYGNVSPGNHKYTVDISKLVSGMYTVEFQTDEKRAITKLTVK
jgi:hypothetical protein